ncbi:hypothetical protein ANANG_G00242210 [Anguilla anguilla]|uniref:Uncharacterized protein n=1 Tax=Anguilla anguilla TaxID=7936 RepID=A0A9D3LYY0_ANGAN|nr:hypothetical protein ANANG_G00242210 [Anguilla anguilla]
MLEKHWNSFFLSFLQNDKSRSSLLYKMFLTGWKKLKQLKRKERKQRLWIYFSVCTTCHSPFQVEKETSMSFYDEGQNMSTPFFSPCPPLPG